MSQQQTISFKVEQKTHAKLNHLTNKLGLNASRLLRDALTEKLEELDELLIVSERLKSNRKCKPIKELWNDLGLGDKVQ